MFPLGCLGAASTSVRQGQGKVQSWLGLQSVSLFGVTDAAACQVGMGKKRVTDEQGPGMIGSKCGAEEGKELF